jgi:anti-anti-sigma factor
VLTKDRTTGILRVSGALDIDAADLLRQALLDHLHESIPADPVRLDLLQVNSCDAASLQVLLAAHKCCCIEAVSPAVVETAAALGFSLAALAVTPGTEPRHAE